VVGVALVGGLIFTGVVTVVVTYRPAPIDDPHRRSNWRQGMPAAAIFYAGSVALTSTRHFGFELVGIVLMIVGFVALSETATATTTHRYSPISEPSLGTKSGCF
jgi:hypothetical protein